MKFKARLEHNGLQNLLAIGQCLDKVCSECVIHLTETSVDLRKRLDVECEVEVFSSLSVDMFAEYRIESKSDNTISFLVGMKNLMRAFRSADQGDETTLKLTKKDGVPCLTLLAETPNGLNVTQDVPILRLISKEGMEDYREPELPPPAFAMSFPDPRHVRTVLERMKAIDKYVVVEFSPKGKLIFKVQTEVVCMRTIYQGLDTEANVKGKMALTVNIAELLSVLHFSSANYSKVLICAVEKKALVIYVAFEDQIGTLTYFCPVVDPNDFVQ